MAAVAGLALGGCSRPGHELSVVRTDVLRAGRAVSGFTLPPGPMTFAQPDGRVVLLIGYALPGTARPTPSYYLRVRLPAGQGITDFGPGAEGEAVFCMVGIEHDVVREVHPIIGGRIEIQPVLAHAKGAPRMVGRFNLESPGLRLSGRFEADLDQGAVEKFDTRFPAALKPATQDRPPPAEPAPPTPTSRPGGVIIGQVSEPVMVHGSR